MGVVGAPTKGDVSKLLVNQLSDVGGNRKSATKTEHHPIYTCYREIFTQLPGPQCPQLEQNRSDRSNTLITKMADIFFSECPSMDRQVLGFQSSRCSGRERLEHSRTTVHCYRAVLDTWDQTVRCQWKAVTRGNGGSTTYHVSAVWTDCMQALNGELSIWLERLGQYRQQLTVNSCICRNFTLNKYTHTYGKKF